MTRKLLQAVSASKYPLDAFLFVQRGLDHTVCRIHGQPDKNQEGMSRHVTGKQLCCGLKDYAIQQYGLMAKPVLQHWQIHSCEDFGHIVFAMVRVGLMHKTQEDSIEDFSGVFDFDEAFTPSLQLSENA